MRDSKDKVEMGRRNDGKLDTVKTRRCDLKSLSELGHPEPVKNTMPGTY